ncbi:MAG: pyridoxal-dependent decarboxylase [Actinomycetota bacterium]
MVPFEEGHWLAALIPGSSFVPFEGRNHILLESEPAWRRYAEKLRRTFSMTAPYLRGTLTAKHTGRDYLEYGPQMSRGFHALKVWMTLKHYGVYGYRKLLSQNVWCAQHLHDLVRASSDFEVLHDPILFVYSFRYAPAPYRQQVESNPVLREEIEEYLDLLNQRIADEIQASGVAFVMTSSVRNRTVLRFSICSHRTTLADIENVFGHLQRVAREMDERKTGPTRVT